MNIRSLLLIAITFAGLLSTCYAEDVKELVLTGEQLRQYSNSYKLPEVLHLREFLNTYADSRNKVDPNEEEAARDLDLKKIDKKIIKAKFIVYWIEGFLGGGKVVTIVSQEHPEIILSFWVYKVTDGIYQVRLLLDRPDKRDLESFKKIYFKYLNDKNLAM
jgi:hypothetical protein